jgi:hypothetical protein
MSLTRMVAVGCRVLWDGELWDVASIDGGWATLRHLRVARSLFRCGSWLSGLAQRTGPSPKPVEGTGAVLDAMGDNERLELVGRLGHVREVLTGYRSGNASQAAPGEPRAAYVPGAALMDHYRAKAEEMGVREITVRRMVAAYQADGASGLIDVTAVLVSRVHTPMVPSFRAFWDIATSGRLLAEATYILDDEEGFANYALADVQRRPPATPAGINSVSPTLVIRLVQTREPYLLPTERLRWRSLTTPKRPSLDLPAVRQRHQAIPAALWTDWAIRLCEAQVGENFWDGGSCPGDEEGRRPSRCGRCRNRGRRSGGDQGLARTLSHVLQLLPPPPANTAILRVLTQLADNLGFVNLDWPHRAHLIWPRLGS